MKPLSAASAAGVRSIRDIRRGLLSPTEIVTMIRIGRALIAAKAPLTFAQVMSAADIGKDAEQSALKSLQWMIRGEHVRRIHNPTGILTYSRGVNVRLLTPEEVVNVRGWL